MTAEQAESIQINVKVNYMNIKFLSAKRSSLTSVEATYSLDGTEFTVEWSSVDGATGKISYYDLQINTKSSNEDLAIRVDDAMREGETDDNPDLDLYLTVRDFFDARNCADYDTPAFEIIDVEEFNADHYGSSRFLTPLGGCSGNDDEFGLGDWSYQFDVLVTNKNCEIKQFKVVYQPEERNNDLKNYSGYDVTTASKYGYDTDESDALAKFCNYDSSVLDALHEKAWDAAKAEYNRLIALLNKSEIKPNND